MRRERQSADTFGAVIRRFMATPRWQSYSASTRATWGRELRLAAIAFESIAKDVIRPKLIQTFLGQLHDRPGKAQGAYKALKQVERWAAVMEDMQPFMIGCSVEGPTGGHAPWSNEQVALAEAHARPELARAITLAANTGQRASDLVKMRWSDVERYEGRDGINITQKKTGLQLWVPITEPLAAAMATWERRPGFILIGIKGQPWTAKALGRAWTDERERNPHLAPLAGMVLHGLRATACVRLVRAGATTRQIADCVGMSEPMVARYTRLSSQKANASAAIIQLDAWRKRTPDEQIG